MTYDDARQYAEQLNAEKFAGYEDWRLPTVEELLSLVEPEGKATFYYYSEYWYWSTDRPSDSGSSALTWGVYFGPGFVGWDIGGDGGYVRAVREIFFEHDSELSKGTNAEGTTID